MLSTRNGYLPLGGDDSSSTEDGTLVLPKSTGSKERWLCHTPCITRLVLVAVVICTMVDLLVLFCLNLQFFPSVLSDPRHMELRSTYINLDVLYSKGNVNSSQHGPIINHAPSFVQVSLTEPSKVMPTFHTGSYMHQLGSVPFVERRLLVTPQISTVAQFRTIDFGMESCTLAVHVPWLNETDEPVSSALNSTLDVYTLPILEKLDNAVSYSSLPTTRSLFARLPLSEGIVAQTPVFPCRALSYQTFLLACSDHDCHVDLIGTSGRESGLFMYQYQTI